MKKIYYSFALTINFILLTNIATAAIPRDTVPSTTEPGTIELRSQYLKKSRHQLIGASVISMVGGLAFTAGLVVVADDLSHLFEPKQQNGDLAEILLFTGLGLIACSTPLFIASLRNKKRANLILKNEAILITPEINTGKQLTALGFAIRF